jgi:hypothetical protein
MKTTQLETSPGNMFGDVCKKAKGKAYMQNVLVEFDFNGITCIVGPKTNLDFLYRDYDNAFIMEWKTIGPDCKEKYDKETQKELDKRKSEAEKKAKIESEKRLKKEEQEKESLESQIKGVELELLKPEIWNKSREVNTDPYGKAALDYAEAWAKLMQVQISEGKTVVECAEETQNGLGFMGITGFMYGCAVNLLSQSWKHGEDLRKWHNKEWGHEGDGVVNPAILSIGKQS